MTEASAGTCPSCGATLAPDAVACAQCGLRTHCAACATPFRDPLRDRFCVTCGEPVAESMPSAAELPAPAAVAGDEPRHPSMVATEPSSLRLGVGRVASALAEAGTRGGRRVGRGAGPGRVDVPPRMQRMARRTLTRASRGVGDSYLELTYALLRARRAPEAETAFEQALAEKVTNAAVLDDLLNAALEARSPGIAARACLATAALEPDSLSESTLREVIEQIDGATARAHGDWIVEHWRSLTLGEHVEPAVRSLCAVLVARVAALLPDPGAALEALEVAWRSDHRLTEEHLDELLGEESLAPQLRARQSDAQALLARANATVGRLPVALEHLQRALDGGVPEGAAGTDLLELRAELLEQSGRMADASEAYVDLGRRYELASDHVRGIAAFRHARELNDANAVAWWYLADSLRLTGETAEFPYIDAALAEAARTAWETGMRLRAPDAQYAWVHLSGALIAELFARLTDDSAEEVERAALQAEQAVALDPASAHGWALIARFHRLLRHPAVALHAAEQACEIAHWSRAAQTERMLTAVAQASEDAETLIDDFAERFGAARDPRVIATRGYRLLLAGDVEAACAPLQRALAIEPGEVRVRARLALCRMLHGDEAEARRQAELVLADTEPGAPRAGAVHRQDRALAAMFAGRTADAEEELSSSLGAVWTNDVEIRMGLALASALSTDFDASKQHAAEAVDSVGHPGDARLLLLYLELLARWGTQELSAYARETAARVQGELDAFKPPDVLAELDSLIAARERGSTSWLVAQGAQGRVLVLERRWREAIDADDQLQEFSDNLTGLPSARARLVKSLWCMRDEAAATSDIETVRHVLDRLTAMGALSTARAAIDLAAALQPSNPAEALREAERGGRLADDGSDDGSRLEARLAQGDALLRAGRQATARDRYERALDGAPAGRDRARVLAHLAVLAGDCRNVGEARDRLRDAVAEFDEPAFVRFGARSLLRECEAVEVGGEPASIASAFRMLIAPGALTVVQRRALATARYEMRRSSRKLEPVRPVIPIKVEVGAGLAGSLARADGQGRRRVEALRSRLLGASGVRIPGVVIAVNGLLEAGRYRILLNEVPYLAGTAPLGGGLVPGSTTDGGQDVTNPWSGIPAGWRVPSQPGDLGPVEGALWMLEGLLRVHLATFVGTAETDYRVNEWVAAGRRDRAALVRRAVPDRGARATLAAVLRRLVRQQVPVNDLGAIMRTVAMRGPGATPTTIVESVRIALADVLPRPSRTRRELELPGDLAEAIERLPAHASADAVSEVVGDLRQLVGSRAPGAFVITVEDPALRVRVQQLSRRVLPSTAVLSSSELAAVAGSAS